MEITISLNRVTIKGNIKSMQDYQQIKNTLDSMAKVDKHIILDIPESISMTSSVIGYLNKLVQKDGVDLQVNVGQSMLMELLSDLNLIQLLKVKQLSS